MEVGPSTCLPVEERFDAEFIANIKLCDFHAVLQNIYKVAKCAWKPRHGSLSHFSCVSADSFQQQLLINSVANGSYEHWRPA